MNWYFVGVDLGQSRDFTAIAILERAQSPGPWDPVVFAWRQSAALRLRHLERVPLGTSYPDVVERIVEVTRSRALSGRCHLVVDGTGVGRPVVDLLRRARPDAILLPALITGGDTEGHGQGFYRIPKRDLIAGVQVLLQTGLLRIAVRMPYGPELLAEMAGMRVNLTTAGHEQYAAAREGTHDDLVLAVALACWGAKKVYPTGLQGDERWCRYRNWRELERDFLRAMRHDAQIP